MDRAHLLNDAFALAESGHVDYSVPLSMTRYLRLEADYVPWRTAYKALTRVESRIRDTEAYPSFRKARIDKIFWFPTIVRLNVNIALARITVHSRSRRGAVQQFWLE